MRYDPLTGEFINVFFAAGSGGLSFPTGLVFGPDGHLYVASLGTDQILKYDGNTMATATRTLSCCIDAPT